MSVKKLVHGASLNYCLVPFNESNYPFSILDRLRQVCYESIEGIIITDKFYSVLDNYQTPIDHWCLPIVKSYETDDPWLYINKRPGDLYHPMSYITGHLTYNVIEYDIWTGEEEIAVLTEIDVT